MLKCLEQSFMSDVNRVNMTREICVQVALIAPSAFDFGWCVQKGYNSFLLTEDCLRCSLDRIHVNGNIQEKLQSTLFLNNKLHLFSWHCHVKPKLHCLLQGVKPVSYQESPTWTCGLQRIPHCIMLAWKWLNTTICCCLIRANGPSNMSSHLEPLSDVPQDSAIPCLLQLMISWASSETMTACQLSFVDMTFTCNVDQGKYDHRLYLEHHVVLPITSLDLPTLTGHQRKMPSLAKKAKKFCRNLNNKMLIRCCNDIVFDASCVE